MLEITRPARQGAGHRGKSDARDAVAAARVVLGDHPLAVPKARDGIVESISVLRNTRASAVKARTQTILQVRNLILTAPEELREALRDRKTKPLIEHLARWRRQPPTDALRATRQALRSLARSPPPGAR